MFHRHPPSVSIAVLIAVGAMTVLPAAHAALQGRDLDAAAPGYEAFYDTVLNITWLADANHAKTSGFSATGEMTWTQAKAWASTVTVGGLTGWRLPTAKPLDGVAFNYEGAWDGTSDIGYGITSPNNEMAYMFHANLGFKYYYDAQGQQQLDFPRGGMGPQPVPGVADGFILNLAPTHGEYWVDQSFEYEGVVYRWIFDFEDDGQFAAEEGERWGGSYAWLVRDGDVSAVPEPGTALLSSLGLLVAVAVARRSQQARDCTKTRNG